MNTDQLKPDHITVQRPNAGKIDVNKAVQLRMKGLSLQDIADHFKVAKSSVHEKLQRYAPALTDLAVYNDNQSNIWKMTAARLLFSLTDEDIKKMPGASRITGAAIGVDKYRLIDGQSTENIAYSDESANLEEIEKELAELETLRLKAKE